MIFFDSFDGDDLKNTINKQLIDRFCCLSGTDEKERVFEELRKKNMVVPEVYLDKVLTKAHRELENKEIKNRAISLTPEVNQRVIREFFEVCQNKEKDLKSKTKFHFLYKNFRDWVRENALNVLNKETITQIVEAVQGAKEVPFSLLMQYNDEWPYGFLAGKVQVKEVSSEVVSTCWEYTEKQLLSVQLTKELSQICWVHFTIWFKNKLNWILRGPKHKLPIFEDIDSHWVRNRLTEEVTEELQEQDSFRLVPFFGIFLFREEQYTCFNTRYRFDDPDSSEKRTYKEIAETLGISMRDVLTHLSRVHERLKTMGKNAYRSWVDIPENEEVYKTLMNLCNIEAKNVEDEKYWIVPCIRVLEQDERSLLEKQLANKPQKDHLNENEMKIFESATRKLSSMILGRRAYPYLSI